METQVPATFLKLTDCFLALIVPCLEGCEEARLLIATTPFVFFKNTRKAVAVSSGYRNDCGVFLVSRWRAYAFFAFPESQPSLSRGLLSGIGLRNKRGVLRFKGT